MKRNYKSDFDFILPFPVTVADDKGNCRREDLGWPDFDWEAELWTSSKGTAFVASCRGGVATNCFNDNGHIHIVVSRHKLGSGVLKVQYHAELPNAIYPDKIQNLFEPCALDIELVPGKSDCISEVDVNYVLPYIKGDKGEPFTWEDFTPEQIAELQKPATDAAKEADATVATLKQDAEATVASLKQDAEATVSQLKQDTAQTVSTLKAEAETAISGMKEDLREMAKYGSYSIDFGKEADTAEDFNMEDADIEIQEISAINVASVAVANGDSVIDVDVSDFAPFRIKSKNRAVWTITRMDDELSSAIGIKFKTIN